MTREPLETQKCKTGKAEKPEFTVVNEDFEDVAHRSSSQFLEVPTSCCFVVIIHYSDK
ncbi:MAG: hypothetical protein KDC37_02570 [Flavobacteriales bacterium]|nr:hypothetical protein [Flavobacteriales bacterium]